MEQPARMYFVCIFTSLLLCDITNIPISGSSFSWKCVNAPVCIPESWAGVSCAGVWGCWWLVAGAGTAAWQGHWPLVVTLYSLLLRPLTQPAPAPAPSPLQPPAPAPGHSRSRYTHCRRSGGHYRSLEVMGVEAERSAGEAGRCAVLHTRHWPLEAAVHYWALAGSSGLRHSRHWPRDLQRLPAWDQYWSGHGGRLKCYLQISIFILGATVATGQPV